MIPSRGDVQLFRISINAEWRGVVTGSFVKLPIDEPVDGRVCRRKASIGFFPVLRDWRRIRGEKFASPKS
jgi:hypothetical protein